MNVLFDTSALVKVFHNEEGSDHVRNLVLNKLITSTYLILH